MRSRLIGLLVVAALLSACTGAAGSKPHTATKSSDASAASSPSPVVPSSSAEPVPDRDTTVATALPFVDEVELNETWLVMAGGKLGQDERGRLEVRRRDHPDRVTTTISTTYPYGSPGCLELDRNVLLWTDVESVVSDSDPGPPGRWSVWQRNLVSGKQRQLAHGLPADVDEDLPCPTAGQGRVAWALHGRVTVRDLDSGTSQIYTDTATPVAITAAGVVQSSWGKSGLQVSLRTGKAYATRLPVVTVERATSLAVGTDRLLVFTVEPGSGTADAGIVSTCLLSACASLTELRRESPVGPGVVGDGFVAWTHSGDSPGVIRFDGQASPALVPGYVPFETLAAFGGTFVYGTQEQDLDAAEPGPTTIHLLQLDHDNT